MKKILLLGLGLTLFSGCAPVLLATGAVAGYAVSRDSMALDLERPWEEVWDAARQELSSRGHVKRENPQKGRLHARVDDADVMVTLKHLTASTVRVTVRARKHLMPKIDVAQSVALGIQKRMESGGGF